MPHAKPISISMAQAPAPRRLLQKLIVAVVLTAVILASFLLSPPVPNVDNQTLSWEVPLCVFRTVTGLPCPFCGLTRSYVCTAHGDLARGFLFHPLGPLLWVVTLVGAIYWSALFLEALSPSWTETVEAGKKKKAQGDTAGRWLFRGSIVLILIIWAVKIFVIRKAYW